MGAISPWTLLDLTSVEIYRRTHVRKPRSAVRYTCATAQARTAAVKTAAGLGGRASAQAALSVGGSVRSSHSLGCCSSPALGSASGRDHTRLSPSIPASPATSSAHFLPC